MPFGAGDVFAGYTIIRTLGTGGMGTVYLVRHPRLPQQNAMKVLRTEFSADPAFIQRFRREADLVAGLSHRNIVPVLDRGEDEGHVWLTMPVVEGIDVEQALEAGGGVMAPERAVRIVTEVAGALDSAHRRGVLHRDVKPANILLTAPTEDDEREHVFLTDFGIAKSLDGGTAITRTGMVVASFAYASPEQIESRPLDARSDVYSLGCVLYRLLTGRTPFPGESLAAAMYGHLALPPPRPTAHVPTLPAAMDAVIARALAKDPAARHPSCRALAADAEQALRSRPVQAAPPPAGAPSAGAPPTVVHRHPGLHHPVLPHAAPGAPAPPRGRGRWVAGAVALAVVIALVVAGLLVSSDSDDPSDAAAGTSSPAGSDPGTVPAPVGELSFRPVIELLAGDAVGTTGGPSASDPVRQAGPPEQAATALATLSCPPGGGPVVDAGPQDYLAACSVDGQTKYLLGPALVVGADVTGARAATQQGTGEWIVEVTFTPEAQDSWGDYTTANIGAQVAFALGGRVVSAPVVQSPITTPPTTITGQFDEESARELAEQLGGE